MVKTHGFPVKIFPEKQIHWLLLFSSREGSINTWDFVIWIRLQKFISIQILTGSWLNQERWHGESIFIQNKHDHCRQQFGHSREYSRDFVHRVGIFKSCQDDTTLLSMGLGRRQLEPERATHESQSLHWATHEGDQSAMDDRHEMTRWVKWCTGGCRNFDDLRWMGCCWDMIGNHLTYLFGGDWTMEFYDFPY